MSRALVSTLPASWSRTRLMGTLFGAQICGSAGHSIVMAVGGIMAAEITGTNAWTGLPVAIGALGMALASWPLAAFMARAGRRRGLVLGYALAVGAPCLEWTACCFAASRSSLECHGRFAVGGDF